MIKRILIFGIFTMILSASGVADKNYSDGIEEFKKGHFKESYQKLDSIFFDYASDSEFNFYYGRAALENGKFHDAIAAFERVLITNPENTRARLELARAYYQSGSLDEAKESFRAVLALNPPEEVSKKAKRFIKKIESLQSRQSLKLSFMAGVISDNNVYSSHESDYYINSQKLTPSNKDITDTAHQEMVDLNYKFDFGRRDFWYLQNNLSWFSQTYNKESSNNLDYYGASIAPSYTKDSITFQIPIKYEDVDFGDEDYLKATTISFLTKLKTTSNTLYSISAGIKNKKFDTDSDKDSKVTTVALKYFLPLDLLSFNLSINSEQERKSNNSSKRVDVEQDMVGVTTGFNIPLSKSSLFYLYYNYKSYSYLDKSSYFNSKREDKYQAIGLNYNYSIYKKFSFMAGGDYIDNSSNQEAYDYDKIIVYARLNYILSL